MVYLRGLDYSSLNGRRYIIASFTDSPQVFLPEGSPAVDLNLYAQTLDLKQSQYDQGVQRIRSSFDQVAGLDVMRGVDKQYLQDKLGALTSQLNQLAGGDFSNQSLVAQAASLAPQIGKDQNVQNAVMSTQQIRSLMTSQKTLKSKDPGSYGVEAEWYDNRAVNDYLGNNELGKLYNGGTSATKLNDQQDLLGKELDKIVPAKTVIRSPDGKYQWKTQDFDVVTNDRIHSIIDGFYATHPDAAFAAKVKGMYTYRDQDAGSMKNIVQSSYQKGISDLYNMNTEYARQITNAPKDSYDFRDSRQKLIDSNMQSIKDMKSKIDHQDEDTGNYVKGDYISKLDDPRNLDDMKQTMYLDNLKGMYGTTLQKNNLTLETTSENFNATKADENYWKGKANQNQVATYNLEVGKAREAAAFHGFKYDQNGNLRSLVPSDPEYPSYIRSLKGKGGTGTDDGHTYQPDTTPGKVLTSGTKATEDNISNQITQYGQVDKDARAEFEKTWLASNGGKTSQDFENYLHDQSQLPLYSTNNDYRAYQKQHSDLATNIATLNELSLKAQAYSEKIVPSGEDANYRAAVADLYIRSGGQTAYYPIGYDDQMRPITGMDKLLEKYKNNPEYDRIRQTALSYARLSEDGASAMKSVTNVYSKRLKAKNDYYETNGKSFQPQQNIYDESEPSALNDVRRRIYDLVSANQYNSSSGKELNQKADASEIKPIGNQISPTGQVQYHFQWPSSKSETGFSDEWITDPQGDATKLPSYKQHVVAQRAVEVIGKTPESGDGVLASDNGLVRFQIKKTYPNGLEMAVLLNGKPMDTKPVASVDDAYNKINMLSNSPSARGGMMTEEEAAYRFASDEKRYRERYKTQ